jgi:hypothetical protein
MRELSAEATALIRAGRGAFRPVAADRDRVGQLVALEVVSRLRNSKKGFERLEDGTVADTADAASQRGTFSAGRHRGARRPHENM